MSFSAKDIYKIYKNNSKEIRAVNGISLDVAKGSSVAIVGPSGAGKSTFLHMLGGLDNPTSGEILLDGINIYDLSDKERANIRNTKIGFVFQFYHLLSEFSAFENVMLPALMKGRAAKDIKARARGILEAVGLEYRVDHKPGELSGGESQRVAIARALVNEPEILLCDEPTGNLDSKTSESIYELLFQLKSKFNMTLVIVTHDENMAKRTERTIRVKDGKLA